MKQDSTASLLREREISDTQSAQASQIPHLDRCLPQSGKIQPPVTCSCKVDFAHRGHWPISERKSVTVMR